MSCLLLVGRRNKSLSNLYLFNWKKNFSKISYTDKFLIQHRTKRTERKGQYKGCVEKVIINEPIIINQP